MAALNAVSRILLWRAACNIAASSSETAAFA
jgi:hypothetical protein